MSTPILMYRPNRTNLYACSACKGKPDMQRIIKASSAAGMVVAADASPALMAKLPMELK